MPGIDGLFKQNQSSHGNYEGNMTAISFLLLLS